MLYAEPPGTFCEPRSDRPLALRLWRRGRIEEYLIDHPSGLVGLLKTNGVTVQALGYHWALDWDLRYSGVEGPCAAQILAVAKMAVQIHHPRYE